VLFTPTELNGAYVIDLERRGDARGFFARAFCADEFARHGLATTFVQMNISFTAEEGTIRGLHYQIGDAAETKVVRCTRGAVYDVIVDLRPDSPTFGKHIGVELTAENRRAVYVPKMFAHGHQALTGDVELLYQVDAFYQPGAERGIRFDDPALAIAWPKAVTVVSEKDRSWPLHRKSSD
jgi:dTDP-4-dehydrorhamnose 3,5-epimerase